MQLSNHRRRLQEPLRKLHAASLAISLVVVMWPNGASALALFRHEHDAQRHCPTDTVVWLDFKKRKYYSSHQKLYGHGLHGSFVCLQEARRNLYRHSLLGFH